MGFQLPDTLPKSWDRVFLKAESNDKAAESVIPHRASSFGTVLMPID